MDKNQKINRNPIKQWFVTFPQVNGVIEKEEFHKMFPPSDYSLTAKEEHENGGYHFHMILKLVKGITKSNMIKWIKAKFPEDYKRIDVQTIRNLDDAITYCNKEDPQPITTGSLEKKIKKISEGVQRLLAEDEENSRMSKFLWDLVIKERETDKTIHQRIWELKDSKEFKEMVEEVKEYDKMKEIENLRKKWKAENRDMAEFHYL